MNLAVAVIIMGIFLVAGIRIYSVRDSLSWENKIGPWFRPTIDLLCGLLFLAAVLNLPEPWNKVLLASAFVAVTLFSATYLSVRYFLQKREAGRVLLNLGALEWQFRQSHFGMRNAHCFCR